MDSLLVAIALIIPLGLPSCLQAVEPTAYRTPSMPSETLSETVEMNDLAQRLLDLGYENLFMRLDYGALDALWQEPGMPEQLERLALDPDAPNQARFLAAEILFHQRSHYPPEEAKAELAPVYAAALSEATIGNPWGLPGSVGESTGQHLVTLGKPAIAPLTALLDDTRSVPYAGSREATFGNRYHYRVKDLAAFYISRICDIPYSVHQNPEDRDAEIEQVRSRL